MTQNEQDIKQVNITLAQAKETIAKSEGLTRLSNNPDFQLVIVEGYFVKQASRLALLSADPTLPSDNTVMDELKSIGHLNQYFTCIHQFGDMASGSIQSYEDTLEELILEDGE